MGPKWIIDTSVRMHTTKVAILYKDEKHTGISKPLYKCLECPEARFYFESKCRHANKYHDLGLNKKVITFEYFHDNPRVLKLEVEENVNEPYRYRGRDYQTRGRNIVGEQEPLSDSQAVKETVDCLVDFTVQKEVDFTALDEVMEIDEKCGISFNDTTDPEAVDFPMGKKEQNEVTNKQNISVVLEPEKKAVSKSTATISTQTDGDYVWKKALKRARKSIAKSKVKRQLIRKKATTVEMEALLEKEKATVKQMSIKYVEEKFKREVSKARLRRLENEITKIKCSQQKLLEEKTELVKQQLSLRKIKDEISKDIKILEKEISTKRKRS